MKLRKILIGVVSVLCILCAAPIGAAPASATTPEPLYKYNMEEELIPIWEGHTSYAESVLPVENEYGGIDPIALLYPIEEIISVQNAERTVTYQKGIDYAVSGGNLIIADDGNIPVLSYAEFHPIVGQPGFESNEGGYVCFHEGTWFHERQIVITYKHKEGYKGYIPEGKAHLLPKITKKLSDKEDINLLVFGDSISVGANSSAFTGISPYLPTYPNLFASKLETEYGVKVRLNNPSKGGMGIDWGLEQISGVLAKQSALDLAVVAFGMNDGRQSPETITSKAKRLVAMIQEKFPDAEVLLVAGMLPNPQAKNFYLQQEDFVDAMLEICEKEGVAVVNMTAVHEGLLERKRYADMTGNNVNHPNDYLARVYAQTLFATMQKKVDKEDDNSQETSDGQTSQPSGSGLSTLLSGCTATISISAGAATMFGAAVVLNKKKDD